MNLFKKSLLSPAVALLICSNIYADNISYSIEKQSLKDAIEKISKKANKPYIASGEIFDGKTSNAIKDITGTQNALDEVLKNSGLEAVMEDGAIIIKKLPVIGQGTVLEPISVNDSYLGSTTEETTSYTTGSMRTATKLDLSLRETPQSVSVITQQMIEDKKIDDFDTLMKNVTGVGSTKGISDNRAAYYLRGFNLDYYQMDGIPITINPYSINNYNIDKFDRVEIVKGSNGLTSGSGNPAGAINMVRKHANSKVFTGSIDASAGTWDTYKLKTDISTPLNDDGSIRGRLVASHKETDTFKDRVHNENDLVYAVIDADITDNTIISAGASYELEDLDGDSNNLPAFYKDGTKTNFDRSKNYSPDWSYWDTERKSYFLDVKQYFANDILLNAVYTHNDIKTDNNYGYLDFDPGLNKDGSGLEYREFGNWLQNIKEDNVDIYSSIPLKIFNREHEIIAGFQYNKQKTDYSRATLSQYTVISNFFTQNGSEMPLIGAPNPKPKYEDTDTQQTAFYLTGKFEIVDDLKLILGGRLTNWEYERYTYSNNTTTKYDVKNEFTPFVGLVYDINENHSAYASYTDIFKPQNFKDANDNLLDPIVGKNYEVGVKGEYFDKKLNAGLTLFRIEQDNVAENTGNKNPITGNSIYETKDGVTSKGVEIEIGGKLTDNWDLSLGFANFEAKDAKKEKVNTMYPRNNINIFTKYSINDFSVGAGVNWKSKGFSKSGTKEVTQDAYATVDVMASYDFSKNLIGQLNINNLFDKTYYSGYSVNAYAYGEPVNGMLSLKYKF